MTKPSLRSLALLMSLVLGACDQQTLSPLPPPPGPMLAGGSNYGMYSVGSYLDHATTEVWYRPNELRPVIATFHLDSLAVKEQLRVMYANGQRRLALILWFGDFQHDPELQGTLVHGHILDSSAKQLHPLHRHNLVRLLELMAETGFEEAILRFGHQGASHPHDWPFWNERRYQDNWAFISDTRKLVETTAKRAQLPVLYDIGMELGGIHHLGQGEPYTRRLWADYVKRFGTERTMGFSISLGPSVVAAALKVFDSGGRRPEMLAVSLYGNEYEALRQLSIEMRRSKAQAMPVIVQETWYNDPTVAEVVAKARADFAINIRYIVQWPLHRGALQPHFSVPFPAEYSAYKP